MRALGVVQAVIVDQEIPEDLPFHDRLLDDPRNIRLLDVAVPNPLRINHDGWTVLALIQATGVIHPNQTAKARPLEFGLERRP